MDYRRRLPPHPGEVARNPDGHGDGRAFSTQQQKLLNKVVDFYHKTLFEAAGMNDE